MIDFYETFTKWSLDWHLQFINFWTQSNSSWPPQSSDLKKHKIRYDSCSFINIELNICVVVAEHGPQNMFCVHQFLLKILALPFGSQPCLFVNNKISWITWKNFNTTLRNKLLAVHLQRIIVWSYTSQDARHSYSTYLSQQKCPWLR